MGDQRAYDESVLGDGAKFANLGEAKTATAAEEFVPVVASRMSGSISTGAALCNEIVGDLMLEKDDELVGDLTSEPGGDFAPEETDDEEASGADVHEDDDKRAEL